MNQDVAAEGAVSLLYRLVHQVSNSAVCAGTSYDTTSRGCIWGGNRV